MLKKVITNLDSSKTSGPDYIPVVVLKDCELELSYILAELLNKCLKESCFPDSWKVSSVVPVFKGYLHYTRTTSRNVSSEAQVKNFFNLVEKLCSVLKIFKFLYFKPSHDLQNL